MHGGTGRGGGIAVDPEEGRPGCCRGVPVTVEAGSEPGGCGGSGCTGIGQSPVVVLGRPLLHLAILELLDYNLYLLQ